jgi:hypothetical protein
MVEPAHSSLVASGQLPSLARAALAARFLLRFLEDASRPLRRTTEASAVPSAAPPPVSPPVDLAKEMQPIPLARALLGADAESLAEVNAQDCEVLHRSRTLKGAPKSWSLWPVVHEIGLFNRLNPISSSGWEGNRKSSLKDPLSSRRGAPIC